MAVIVYRKTGARMKTILSLVIVAEDKKSRTDKINVNENIKIAFLVGLNLNNPLVRRIQRLLDRLRIRTVRNSKGLWMAKDTIARK